MSSIFSNLFPRHYQHSTTKDHACPIRLVLRRDSIVGSTMIRFCGSETQRKVNIPQRRRRKATFTCSTANGVTLDSAIVELSIPPMSGMVVQ